MKNRNITFKIMLCVLVCFASTPQVSATCHEGCDLTHANTFLGDDALPHSTGSENTAVGKWALRNNTSGFSNTAFGINALTNERTGHDNTAIGGDAMYSNVDGNDNTAVGDTALWSNIGGISNVAVGSLALQASTNGSENTATGYQAMYLNSTGNNNTAYGQNALGGNTTGDNNIALGYSAGGQLTTGNNNIDIGNEGIADESGVIRIGTDGTHIATYIAGIRDSGLAVATAIGITRDGQLGVRASSRRYKEEIKSMDEASEAILSLKPVTFRYKHELDPAGIPQFGLVAEDVDKVNPDLVVRDKEGKPFTVRYEEINAMLLNEFIKEHKKVEELEATVATLAATVKEQATRTQR